MILRSALLRLVALSDRLQLLLAPGSSICGIKGSN
jgi:uncharacterized membrane protein YadS